MDFLQLYGKHLILALEHVLCRTGLFNSSKILTGKRYVLAVVKKDRVWVEYCGSFSI